MLAESVMSAKWPGMSTPCRAANRVPDIVNCGNDLSRISHYQTCERIPGENRFDYGRRQYHRELDSGAGVKKAELTTAMKRRGNLLEWTGIEERLAEDGCIDEEE